MRDDRRSPLASPEAGGARKPGRPAIDPATSYDPQLLSRTLVAGRLAQAERRRLVRRAAGPAAPPATARGGHPRRKKLTLALVGAALATLPFAQAAFAGFRF